MSFVSLADFAKRYGPIAALDEERIEVLLADACAQVTDVVGNDYSIDPVPAAMISPICNAVNRAYNNPAGLSMEVTGSHTWMTNQAGSGVFFTSAEWRTIRRAAAKLGMGSATLRNNLWPENGAVTDFFDPSKEL